MSWESWLESRFPGFLLPSSAHRAVSTAEASRFLRRMLKAPPDQVRLLKTASLFATPRHAQALDRFATKLLPDLVRRLPSTTLVERRVWEGGFQGRLDVRATLVEHMAGQRTTFVTRARRRSFDLPESVLVRSVAARLCAGLERLHKARLAAAGWAKGVVEHGDSLRHLLNRTLLREVQDEPITARHQQAARQARHPCYGAALAWHRTLTDALDRENPEKTARLLAEGALEPAGDETRFEVAVVLRLVEALWQRLEPEGWTVSHGLIAHKRKDVATFRRGDVSLSVFYDQAPNLPLGPRDLGARHYFGVSSRWRPDFSVRLCRPGHPDRWTVGEVKHSAKVSYLLQGFGEALGYRHEYSDALTGWPKGILVVPTGVIGEPLPEHDVVASAWDSWPPSSVVEGLVAT